MNRTYVSILNSLPKPSSSSSWRALSTVCVCVCVCVWCVCVCVCVLLYHWPVYALASSLSHPGVSWFHCVPSRSYLVPLCVSFLFTPGFVLDNCNCGTLPLLFPHCCLTIKDRVSQDELQPDIWPRVTLNSCPSCLYLMSACFVPPHPGFTGR